MSSYNDTVDILTKCIRNREDHCCIPCSSMLWLDDAFGIAKINSPKSFDVRSIKYRKEDAGMTVFPQYGLSSRQYNETLVECNKRASEILSVVWDEDPLSFIRNLPFPAPILCAGGADSFFEARKCRRAGWRSIRSPW